MPFVQTSNDQTTKLLLYTVNRSNGTVHEPSWDVQVPLQIPPHHTALCTVETFISKAPFLFHSAYFTPDTNRFNATNTGSGATVDCWNLPATPTDSLKTLFFRTRHVDMTDLENLAQLLME